MARQAVMPPKSGATNKTPAPTRVRASDLEGVFGGGGQHDGQYGQNRYGGASSVAPGQRVESPMAQDLRTTAAQGADGGNVLDAIAQKGVGAAGIDPLTGDAVTMAEGVAGSQIRKIGAKNVPDAFGMESARSRQPSYPGPKTNIPGGLSDDNAQPVRQPGK